LLLLLLLVLKEMGVVYERGIGRHHIVVHPRRVSGGLPLVEMGRGQDVIILALANEQRADRRGCSPGLLLLVHDDAARTARVVASTCRVGSRRTEVLLKLLVVGVKLVGQVQLEAVGMLVVKAVRIVWPKVLTGCCLKVVRMMMSSVLMVGGLLVRMLRLLVFTGRRLIPLVLQVVLLLLLLLLLLQKEMRRVELP